MSFTPDTLLRQWQTLRLIPRYPCRITAGELCNRLGAEGFSVGKRTVERDLLSLALIFPLMSDERSKPYGWSWQKDAPAFDLPGLSNSEAITLLLAKEHLHTLLPVSAITQLHPYFSLAEQKLSTLERHSGIAGWQRKVRVIPSSQPLIPPKIDEAVQAILYEALLHDLQCDISYQKRDAAEPENYPVHPLGLVQRGQVIYLVCTIKTYPHVRLLALHRIRSVQLLNTPISIPADFDLDEYISSGALGWFPKDTIRLEAAFSSEVASHLEETPLSEDQAMTELPDGRIKLSATVRETLQLRWWLQGFGDSVEVLAPPELRLQISQSIRNLAFIYADDSRTEKNGP
jgi:predicted DNA-binding transcriptional regulator YafY